MATAKKIMEEIAQLTDEERKLLLQQLKELYLLPDAHVLGENYNFWLNDKDDAYDHI